MTEEFIKMFLLCLIKDHGITQYNKNALKYNMKAALKKIFYDKI